MVNLMNRTDRLLGLVLELRLRGETRAEDLARHFSTSKRTIYRDIQALAEAGVPVISLMGQGYRLAEGYFLPPLAFTEHEAMLTLLGLGAINDSFDPEYRAYIENARRKILGVLSDQTRQKVEALHESLLLAQTHSPDERNLLGVLRRAMLNNQTVQFRYFTRYPGDGKVSLRQVDPYALLSLDGAWLLSGYCHLRKDRRNFRLSRIESLTITRQTFQRPADFSLEALKQVDDRTVFIRAVLDDDIAPWVSEDHFFYIHMREPHPEGVLVTLRVRHIDEAVQWVLGWGKHIRVLEPPDLILRVRHEAAAMFKNHQTHD
jgi:predicted DNA-binding transcriptional regulator YafY